jgi:hypothetical protein
VPDLSLSVPMMTLFNYLVAHNREMFYN